MGGVRIEPEIRFDAKWHSEDMGFASPCWVWTGARVGKLQHGRFWNGERQMQAHQFSYERHFGPVPEGLELDHLCRVPFCVNPNHLEAVTHQENCNRGSWNPVRWRSATHCDAGHEFTPENTRYRNDKGWKLCRACDRSRAQRMRDRRKAAKEW